MKANILTRKDDFAGAAAILEKARSREPRNTTVLDNLGYALFKLRRFEDAAASYGRSIELDPEDVAAFEGRANCLAELGRFDEADKDMSRVVAGRPTADSYSNRGAVRSRAGRHDDAMADYREALRVVRAGGRFAFVDYFYSAKLYGSPAEFEGYLSGLELSHFELRPLREMMALPLLLRHPRILGRVGIVYGRK